MNNTIIDAQDQRIAIHVLQQTGEMPAFYSVPKKQLKLEKAFIAEMRKGLEGLGTVLLQHVHRKDRILSPENLFGYFEADLMKRATSLEEAYSTHMGIGMEMGFMRGATEVKELIGVTMNWDLKNPAVQRILQEQSFVASEATMNRMISDIDTILRRGYDRGLSGDQVARLLDQKFYELKHQRLEFISRTEIGSAQNQGAMMTYDEADIQNIQWLATKDGRTRYSHLLEHAKVIKRGDRFPTTGLLHPGDKSGDISEWVACRCAVRAKVKVPK